MARAHLSLDAGTIGQIAVRAYLGGDKRLGASSGASPGLYGRAHDLKPAWDTVRNIIFHAEALLFHTEGGSGNPEDGGIPWAGLGHSYAGWRRQFFPGPILQLSGNLMRQLTGQSGDHYEQRTFTSFAFGSNAPVGQWSGKHTSMYEGGIGGLKHEGEAWSLDPDNEDVGGLQAEGGFVHRERNGSVSDSDPARPPISLNEGDVGDIIEVLLDRITEAPRINRLSIRGLSYGGGVPHQGMRTGRVYKQQPSGRRVRIGTI